MKLVLVKRYLPLIIVFISYIGTIMIYDYKVKSLDKELKVLKENHINAVLKERVASGNALICQAKLNEQNEFIKSMELKESEPKIEEKLITKYEKIEVPVKDDKCEKKLRYYEELFYSLQ